MEIPPISRLYLTGAFLTTAACAVDIISPFSLYFNWELVVGQGQIWRLLTSYLFFGVFSIDFLFHMYFLVREWIFLLIVCWWDDFCLFRSVWNRGGCFLVGICTVSSLNTRSNHHLPFPTKHRN